MAIIIENKQVRSATIHIYKKGDTMPSTTVHLPDQLLLEIDRIVKEESISRNRFIVKACEKALKNSAGKWPDDFFKSALNQENLQLLREGVAEMETAIIKSRKNRMDTKPELSDF